ncbi:Carbon-nitrogen hydrolase, partial [Lobosporangium transversale]
MAFTGYVFTSKDHIRPFLEDAENGPSVLWAKSQAQRLNAHVQVGYPEKRTVTKDGQAIEEYYNSICFISPAGALLTTYAKHFLYYTDENWAEEGPGFMSMHVDGMGQVGFGICMDVNPYRFKADFSDYEFATFHCDKSSQLILCSMAWNSGEEAPKKEKKTPPSRKPDGDWEVEGDDKEEWEDIEEEEEEEEGEEEKAEMLKYHTIKYWAVRMEPFYEKSLANMPNNEAYVVIANRIGIES